MTAAKPQPRRASTATIVQAMRTLQADIVSGDGVANAACGEAADRLQEMQQDIATVLWAISRHAGCVNRRTKAGRAFRAAADRLAGEVL